MSGLLGLPRTSDAAHVPAAAPTHYRATFAAAAVAAD